MADLTHCSIDYVHNVSKTLLWQIDKRFSGLASTLADLSFCDLILAAAN
jgi:hypothetical protein